MAETNITLHSEMHRLHDVAALIGGAQGILEHESNPEISRLLRLALSTLEQSLINLDEIDTHGTLVPSTNAPWAGCRLQ